MASQRAPDGGEEDVLMGKATITGMAAVNVAGAMGLTVGKYADPTEGAREGLSVDEAREIAAVDPSLVYITLPAEQRVAVIPALAYEDHDDCLSAALSDVAEETGLGEWQLSSAWDDDLERSAIVVTVA